MARIKDPFIMGYQKIYYPPEVSSMEYCVLEVYRLNTCISSAKIKVGTKIVQALRHAGQREGGTGGHGAGLHYANHGCRVARLLSVFSFSFYEIFVN